MRVLVINPWVTDFKLYDEWMHPIGLYALISFLVHNDRQVDYINCLRRDPLSKSKRYSTGDFPFVQIPAPPALSCIPRRYKRYGITDEDFSNQLRRTAQPELIFIGSGMTYWIEGVGMTAKKVRKHFPQTPILVGGIAATLAPEMVSRALADIDRLFVLSGPLPHALLNSPLFGAVKNEPWRFSLTDLKGIVSAPFHAPVLATLGCPLRCSYCASSRLQPMFIIRETDTVFDEMKFFASEFRVRDFSFYDDALLFRADRTLLPLADKIEESGFQSRLHTPNGLHLRYITEPVAQALARCGFKTLRFGYESGSERFLTDTNGKALKTTVARKVKLLFKYGFSRQDIGIYVMAGLPGQKHTEVIAEMEFVGSLGVKAKPVFLSPVPSTSLFDKYKEIFPRITREPVLHNDLYFITLIEGWSWEKAEEVRAAARQINGGGSPLPSLPGPW